MNRFGNSFSNLKIDTKFTRLNHTKRAVKKKVVWGNSCASR